MAVVIDVECDLLTAERQVDCRPPSMAVHCMICWQCCENETCCDNRFTRSASECHGSRAVSWLQLRCSVVAWWCRPWRCACLQHAVTHVGMCLLSFSIALVSLW